MFLIRVNLTLTNQFRKTPIRGNSYRPLLYFSNQLIRSGLLVIDEGEELKMDQKYDNRLIKIYVYRDLDTKGEFFVGRTFILSEGGTAGIIGEGVITEVIGEEP